ncbi:MULTISPECIES: pyocin S6 family toxin immunity protein [Pseudomonas]|uniref:pyocin S6 family toxin immunity protein n=1 Tax=Pseudomonas sp. RW409 TaxID=2202895 RepID=UPI0021148602|nr:pyocin S6 family toxin immunity protein [Pseudomonas sp. RW409]
MPGYLTGFSPDGFDDTSLKYELDVAAEFEQRVMDILGWESLAAEADGERPLTNEQAGQIAIKVLTRSPRYVYWCGGIAPPIIRAPCRPVEAKSGGSDRSYSSPAVHRDF